MAKKKWIAGAIGTRGSLHRALGIPESKKIPKQIIRSAAKKPGRLGKMARLALTLAKFRK
jgi:hypothetical protein